MATLDPTLIADLVKRPEFYDYVTEAITLQSKFYQSGVISRDPEIARRVGLRGEGDWLVNLPFYNRLENIAGDAEVETEGEEASVEKITAGVDIANITRRIKAFGASDLAGEVTGTDPMKEIASQVAYYWVIQQSKKLFATLDGVFAANVAQNSSDLVLDLTGGGTLDTDATLLTKTTLLDGAQLLGDAKDILTAIAMPSAVETYLATLDANASLFKPSEVAGGFRTYNGRRVIIDDSVPIGTYEVTHGSEGSSQTKKKCTYCDLYLFGEAAVAYAPAFIRVPAEMERHGTKSETTFITRSGDIMHLRGVKWAGTSKNASNTELKSASNWSRVWNRKTIRCVKVRANLTIEDVA